MNVSGIIVTRGDVDLGPCFETWPVEWEQVVYHNGSGRVTRLEHGSFGAQFNRVDGLPDLSVYGRYAAIEYASHDLVFVQDDDVVVADPQAIVDAWEGHALELGEIDRVCTDRHVVCNMPQEFRHDGYTDSALVGFGAAFHREAPRRAFGKFWGASRGWPHETRQQLNPRGVVSDFFHRTCDVVFTTLTPRVLVDVPKRNREFAEDANRMYRQPTHTEERAEMLKLARQVRDA